MLLGILQPDEDISELVVLGPLELVLLHEVGGDGFRLTLHEDVSCLQEDGLIRHPGDGLGPV